MPLLWRFAAGRPGISRSSELVQLDEPLPEAPDLGLDLVRGLAVAPAALRQAVEAHWLAERDRDRMEVAGAPGLGAVDGAADDRRALLQRDHRGARLHLARDAGALARPLGEEAERGAG